MIQDIENLYRNDAALEDRLSSQSTKQVFMNVFCDDLDEFLEYETQITGSYIRNQCLVIKKKQYSFIIPEGMTLLQLIQQNNRFTICQIEVIYKQLLEALYQIHKKYSLGRCFHVRNIYYHNNKIQLAVFGFYPNLQLIPPEYLERGEQNQRRDYSQSIDVWLVGCIIFQLFTGEILNRFQTIQEYCQFYNQIKSKRIENNWKNRIMQMLHPQEVQRCTFFQMHHEILNSNQKGIKQFYKTTFLSQNYIYLIKAREQIDDDYIEWAVPQEFTTEMVIPKMLNPFRDKYNYPNVVITQRNENVNPYPRITNSGYYSSPIQPSPPNNDQSQNSSNGSNNENLEERVQYPELNFLTNKCRDQNDFLQYKAIWIELHFESYKWYLIGSLKEYLERSIQEQQNEGIQSPLETLGIYCLLKMSIIMRQEFLNQWNTGILNFDKNIWQQFIKKSGQAKRFYNDVRMQLIGDQSVIDQNFMNCNNNFQHYSEYTVVYDQIKQSITETINEQTFNEFKLPYRIILRSILIRIGNSCQQCKDTNKKLELYLLQLKIIICMAIQQIFLPQNRDFIFRIVKQTVNITNFDNPYYLESIFFQQNEIRLMEQQIKIIEQDYFGSKR
ncbi:unnamed protein product [Paramecium sonneborni]|uniref:Protein kinase domain-containing protein n=1 Tax=Paramecium sonneborni TaxID=65129 RepID=A0A8S1REX1_9CILI|nr:unnamed protein product [Paramecium sonneborni]